MTGSKVVLAISGLVAMVIGGAILVTPAAFFASSGVALSADPSLLSEVRAPGGALLVAGLVIALGAFFAELTLTAGVVSALLYLSYGLSRVLGMAVDGMPATGLVVATAVEIGLGLAGVVVVGLHRRRAEISLPRTDPVGTPG